MPRPAPDPRDAPAPRSGQRPIEAVGTSVAAFVGLAESGPTAIPLRVHSWPAFERGFGADAVAVRPLRGAVHDFFLNGGQSAVVVRVDAGLEGLRQGLRALEPAAEVNLLVLPDVVDPGSGFTAEAGRAAVADAAALCERMRAMLLLDPPPEWTSALAVLEAATGGGGLAAALGTDSSHAAVFFPRVHRRDQLEARNIPVVASGAIAGVIARTDAAVGVWKAPAGADAVLRGATGVDVQLRQDDFTKLGRLGVNCLRELPGTGIVVWGARTLQGGDAAGSDWKYVSVRRTALLLEQSIEGGLEWARFEPNDEPLWESVRGSVTEFLLGLFRAGAFRGRSPDEAFFVRCGRDTMTQDDLDEGRLIVEIGFAPARPAEFVVLRIGSHARPPAG